MAQIDLKNATVYIRDGYGATGAVNLLAGYVLGVTTIAIDGFTGIVPDDMTFTFTGHTTKYKVTAHTETLGNTSSITFAPPFAAATLADGTAINFGPRELEVKIGEGNLTYSEKRTMEYKLNRGRLDTVKEGDEQPVDVRMDFTWEFLRASTGAPVTVKDALKKRGNASDWVSASADLCEPYAVDVVIEHIPPCEDEEWEVITLSDFRYEELAHDMRNSSVSVTGKCNIKEASEIRVAPTV